MPEKKLRELLAELEAQVEQSDAMEALDKERLNELQSQIRLKLDNPDEGEQFKALTSQVEEAITSLEAAHPTATGILNNIMVTLTSMGI